MMGWTLNVLGVIVMFKQDSTIFMNAELHVDRKRLPLENCQYSPHANALAYLRDLPMARESRVELCAHV